MEGDKFMLLPEDGAHDEPIFSAKIVKSWPVLRQKFNMGLYAGISTIIVYE